MTGTRTRTITITNTLEEKAVLAAISVRHNGRPGRWTMKHIMETVHQNAESSDLKDVPDWLTPVIVGQLIERGLVYRTGNDPEGYVIA